MQVFYNQLILDVSTRMCYFSLLLIAMIVLVSTTRTFIIRLCHGLCCQCSYASEINVLIGHGKNLWNKICCKFSVTMR